MESLANKYRPKDFEDVVEQSAVVSILKKQLESMNSGNKANNYNTLLSMLEVINMQRKKILSIKKGNLYLFIFR